MKIYCYYTGAYQILIDEWFFPSARKEHEVILKQGGARNQNVLKKTLLIANGQKKD